MIKNLNNFYGYAYDRPRTGGSVKIKNGATWFSNEDVLRHVMYRIKRAWDNDQQEEDFRKERNS